MTEPINGNGKILDFRITLGAIIQIAVLVVAIAVTYGSIEGRLNNLEKANDARAEELSSVNVKLDIMNGKLNDIAVAQGRNQQRLQDYFQGQQNQNRRNQYQQ